MLIIKKMLILSRAGWKVIDDMLKSEDRAQRDVAFENLKLLSSTKSKRFNLLIKWFINLANL